MKLEVARPLGLATILVAAVLILVPFVNVAPSIVPIRIGTPDGRFGTLGFLLTSLTMPTLGLGLLTLGAVLRSGRSVLRIAFALAIVLAVLVGVGVVVFVLDGSDLKNRATDPGVQRLFKQGLVRTLVLALLALPGLVAVAFASRAALKQVVALEEAGKDSRLFVGENK